MKTFNDTVESNIRKLTGTNEFTVRACMSSRDGSHAIAILEVNDQLHAVLITKDYDVFPLRLTA